MDLNIMLQFVNDHSAIIIGILLGISELLASIPSVKANSIFQFVVGLLKKKEEEK